MHVIKGGTYDGVDYSCMYNASYIIADEKRRKTIKSCMAFMV